MAAGFLEESKFREAVREARQSQDAEEKMNKILDALEALKKYFDEKSKPDPFSNDRGFL